MNSKLQTYFLDGEYHFRFKPIIAEHTAVQCIEYAKGVVYTLLGVFVKMVTVEVDAHALIAFIFGHVVIVGQLTYAVVKVCMKFLLRDATDVGICWQHGDVYQIVQVTEHAHLSELRHTSEESEADVAVA